ncbi:hypothetical protein AVEN_15042-1 [Araneus ventricosus]|uniref:C2H2-type domain-containing protein n=1 Tax=Araneus ventricosus TaxID=182803 RepID=A0A4Y2NHA3_ARAVE|nr:hypothetical protein AVEN_15042-1 [Araneus ventricosus]
MTRLILILGGVPGNKTNKPLERTANLRQDKQGTYQQIGAKLVAYLGDETVLPSPVLLVWFNQLTMNALEGFERVATEETSPGGGEDAMLLSIPVCGAYRCTLCVEEFDRADRLSRHARERHSTPVTFTCSQCERRFGNFRSASIHYGKCNGPRPETVEVLPFACSISVCGRTFDSKRAMTQHKRHAHPTALNEERLKALKRLPGNRIWSLEEEKNFVEAIKELRTLDGLTQRNLAAAFPGKSVRQIFNKWKVVRRVPPKWQRANPDPSPTAMAGTADEPRSQPTSRVCEHGAMQELETSWRYVVKTTHRVIQRIEASGPPKPQDRKMTKAYRRQVRRGAKNCYQRRKRRFAEVQRMWDFAPDKLATIILDGENARVTPDLKVAERHFKALFETPNDLCGQLDYTGNKECIAPAEFTAEEVKRVIQRCRLRGASGPDGLRPVSLKRALKRGVGSELATLFSICG